MTDVINGAGWKNWNTGDDRTDHVSFGEFENSGDGSKGERANFSTELSEPVTIESVLGSNYESWVDTIYLS